MKIAQIVAWGLAEAAFAAWGAVTPPPAGTPTAQEIVARSVANNNADWDAAPHYNYTSSEVVTKHGVATSKTYDVLMIGGAPYNKLIKVNGEPLSPQQAAREEQKLQKETALRRQSAHRQSEVAEYLRERSQDHELMTEMVRAFNYKLMGEETVNGRRCYVLKATPRPGYRPPNRDTKVLTGMRGTMWVDTQDYQWVKVKAEVFRPVAFGLFIAQVQPGTEFELEESPVSGNLWMPSRFLTRVNAKILYLFPYQTSDLVTYWNYRPAGEVQQAVRTK